jgi:hypothetical protein
LRGNDNNEHVSIQKTVGAREQKKLDPVVAPGSKLCAHPVEKFITLMDLNDYVKVQNSSSQKGY